MSTSNGDQFQRLLFVASCEVKTDPEFPARGSSYGNGAKAMEGLKELCFDDHFREEDPFAGLRVSAGSLLIAESSGPA